VNDISDRQADHTLEQRVDSLLARVHAARDEVVDRGLDAVRIDREHRAGAGPAA